MDDDAAAGPSTDLPVGKLYLQHSCLLTRDKPPLLWPGQTCEVDGAHRAASGGSRVQNPGWLRLLVCQLPGMECDYADAAGYSCVLRGCRPELARCRGCQLADRRPALHAMAGSSRPRADSICSKVRSDSCGTFAVWSCMLLVIMSATATDVLQRRCQPLPYSLCWWCRHWSGTAGAVYEHAE